jgi:hypothetical protein
MTTFGTRQGSLLNYFSDEGYMSDKKHKSKRDLAWLTDDKELISINEMSDTHLLGVITLLRRRIMLWKLETGKTSVSALTLRYMEDEAKDRGLNHEP